LLYYHNGFSLSILNERRSFNNSAKFRASFKVALGGIILS
jgi:hypothetical protein